MTVLAALKVVLGLDTGPFQKGATQAQLEAQKMARNMKRAGAAVAAAGAAIMGSMVVQQAISMAKAGLEYASSLGEVSQQLGVTTDALQEYRYAASQAGLSAEEMDGALGQLTRRIGEAGQGTKAQAEAFQKLGISVKDANGNLISAGDALPQIAEALKGIHSPAERAAILVDLFGKSGQKLEPLLAGGAKGINGLRDAAHRLGLVLTQEQIQKAADAADKFSALKQVLDSRIATVVAENADSILELANSLEALADKAFRAYKALKQIADTPLGRTLGKGVALTYEYNPLGLTLKGIDQSASLISPGGGGGNTSRPGANRRTSGLWKGAKFGTLPSANSNFTSASDLGYALGLAPLLDIGAGKVGQVTSAYSKLYDTVVRNDVVDAIAAQMVRLDVEMVAPATKATKKTAEAFRQLAAEVQPLLDRLFPEARALNAWRGDLATLDRAEKGGLLSGAQAAEARKRLNREAISGTLDAGAGAFGDLVAGAFGKVKGSMGGLSDSMEDMRGKLLEANKRIGRSFTDMAQEAVRAIGTLGHAIKDGDFFDILDAVVGLGIQLGGMGLFGSKVAASINGVKGNANGTRYFGGGLSMVGERGPELMYLPRGTQITPNNKLAFGAGGGTTINNNFTGNLMTPEFWERIQAGDSAAAQAGAQGGATLLMHRQSRSLGR